MSVTIKSSPDASHESDCPGRTQSKLPPEVVERVLDLLVIQRHEFKERHECFQLLEANRREIVYWRGKLLDARRSRSAPDTASCQQHGEPAALPSLAGSEQER
jgi:hypothetical protein